jgi:hypothetical protein
MSTTGMVEDDYDLMLDPARMLEIDSFRVYTGLSNLATGRNGQFDGSSDNFFLVGGTGSLAQARAGVLLDRSGSVEPLFTGMYGRAGESLFGFGRLVQTELLDLDSNGTYDYKRETWAEARADQHSDVTDGFVGAGYRLGGLRLGASLGLTRDNAAHADAARNYRREQRDSSLVGRRPTFRGLEKAVGVDYRASSEYRFGLSGWYDAGPFSLGLGGAAAPTADAAWHRYDESRHYDASPDDSLIRDITELTSTDSLDLTFAGLRVRTYASAFWRPRGDAETRLRVGYTTENSNQGAAAGWLSAHTADSVCRPGRAQYVDSISASYGAARASRHFDVGLTQLVTLAGRLRFGLGVEFGTGSEEDEFDEDGANWSRYDFDNGDSVRSRADYTMTVSSREQRRRRTTSAERSLSVPAGLEVGLTPSLALRLGTSYTVTWADVTRVEELTASEPTRTRYEYGDGTFRETVGAAQQYPGQSESQSTVEHAATFSYGVGFSPLYNLRLDLTGFSRLTDLTGWRLSATLAF